MHEPMMYQDCRATGSRGSAALVRNSLVLCDHAAVDASGFGKGHSQREVIRIVSCIDHGLLRGEATVWFQLVPKMRIGNCTIWPDHQCDQILD